ncbi:hypothetical protein [Actinokineospora sp.]|uniref:hypothetical protein n=1 Tax=Actinokineospora sp. TaxID=1872133 RepID=UPI003D6BDDAC
MDDQRGFEVVVIGAGASGIGAGVGGTWRANTYPGCACDVPSAPYSFSFAPNPEWSRAFAEQPEILDYLRRVSTEHGVDPHVRYPWILRLVQRIGLAHLLLTVSDTYYPALTRPNVTVHPHAVQEIRGSHVVGAGGAESEVDAIILGTGFRILDMPLAGLVFDAEGRSLAEHWRGSPVSYLGTTVAGFPDVQRRYNDDVRGAPAGTVHNTGGCSSYYLDSNGRNSFSWPWSTGRMRSRLAVFDPSDYIVRAPAGRPAEMT